MESCARREFRERLGSGKASTLGSTDRVERVEVESGRGAPVKELGERRAAVERRKAAHPSDPFAGGRPGLVPRTVKYRVQGRGPAQQMQTLVLWCTVSSPREASPVLKYHRTVLY